MKLAAIDIGSNAIRFLITNVLYANGKEKFKKLEYVRFPLRLGQEVFTRGQIGSINKDKFYRLMNAYKLLIDLYEVDDYFACATSALRESKNGQYLIKEVEQLFGLKIHLISGDEEAKMINSVIINELPKGKFLHIDVGGGSTELNVIADGHKIDSKSFKLGSVRGLEKKNSADKLENMFNWIQDSIVAQEFTAAVGTGGNINKLYELSDDYGEGHLKLKELYSVQKRVNSLSMKERLFDLQLNQDRADVIIPASKLYAHAMESAQVKKIIVPDVGLKDGIIKMLYDRQSKTKEFNL